MYLFYRSPGRDRNPLNDVAGYAVVGGMDALLERTVNIKPD